MLFIDEAYSLVAEQGQDPYGDEAVQALLKRAEDDRHRLVVILAGYPEEMKTLLNSNPGLSSRFNRELEFGDYTPLELARIFGWLCDKNHYKLAEGTRPKLMLGLTELYREPRPPLRQRPSRSQPIRTGDSPDGQPHRRYP